MYESFFGLEDLPFRLTPDPRYLFMSGKHREAFAHLLYGVNEGSGFVSVTGEVGSGKTTLIRALLRDTDEKVVIVYIVNPVLTSTELLQTINAELDLPSSSSSRKELIEELNAFLHRTKEEEGRTVVIVDEAQNLDPVVLEQLRLLSNLETETEKLIQIVLVGQPELRQLLERHDLRQLNQRVTVRWHLEALDRTESGEYLRHRLRVAGAENELFEPRAIDLIYQFSGGVPRLLNILAHRSLLVAFTKNAGKVGVAEVADAARELGHGSGPVPTRQRSWLTRAALGAGVLAAAGLVAFFMFAPLERWPAVSVAERGAEAVAVDEAGPSASGVQTEPAAAEVVEKAAMRRARGPRRGTARRQPVAEAPEGVPGVERGRADVEQGVPGVERGSTDVEQGVPGAAPKATAPVAAAPAGELPAVETPPEDAGAIARRLAHGSVFEGATRSLSHLLELWGAARLSGDEVGSGSLDLEAIADSRGLRYLAAQMNTAFLRLIDLPAIVELELPADAGVRYVLVAAADPAGDRLVLEGGVSLSWELLGRWWNGRAHVLWRDVGRLERNIGQGSGGPAVRKLQEMLRELGAYDGAPSGRFDEATEGAVRSFQESRSVAVDGVVGPITQILLYNSLGRFERPTLEPGPDGPTDGFR